MKEALLKENISGREAILCLLKRRVADLKDGYRQNIALLGNPTVGKSAVLQEFTRCLSDEKVLPIYLEIEDIDFGCFVHKYIGTLLSNFLKIKSATSDQDLDVLEAQAKRFIPVTVERIRKILLSLEKAKFLETYKELISLQEIFFEETGIFCIVILDEFQNLEDFGLSSAFQELGKKIMLQKHCLYIVASSRIARAKKILSEKLSLLFGNFDLVDILAFDIRASQNFIDQRLSGLSIDESCKNFLIDFTAGYPLYLDIIIKEIKGQVLLTQEKIISAEFLTEILSELLFERNGFFYQHFSLLLERAVSSGANNNLTATLLSIANGHNKLKELTNLKISRLLELNIISKNGNFYYICDRLFAFWLKSVYQANKKSFNCDIINQNESFKDLLIKAINLFYQSSQRGLLERVTELFYSFDNEYFQFNGHKFRLPIFKDIRSLNIEKPQNSTFDILIAQNQDASWLILLDEKEILEPEIAFYLERIKSSILKPEKKILITVKDIEPNARLKALQEKIWIWNLTELNLLMNFYHKPYFIK